MAGENTENETGLRLAIIEPSLAGVLRNRTLLIEAARRRGHAVLVLAPSQLSGEVAALHAMGAEHRSFDPSPPGMAFLARRRLVAALKENLQPFKPDAVLVSGARLAGAAAAASRQAGVGRIVTLVNDLPLAPEDGRAALAQEYRRAARWSAAVVCHNAADLATARTALRLRDATRLVSVPGSGVDLQAFEPTPPALADGPVTFLMIADPDARAAIGAYASAAQALARSGIPATCLLATDREAAHDTSILTVSGVEFLGKASDTAALLARADVAVHLSVDDGAPVALREALAAARPVITIDVPGCREAVDERVNGCRIPPYDPEALVAAMTSFHNHRDLLPAEGRASRLKAERYYATAPAVATYLECLGL